ncbi:MULTISPECIES: cupin domain-containing protein [Hyphobacterium]|uniref:Cupin domain-containing protein n=1 Tax=Hyphobacterium vulgare TaxID=1736751 RepID=A0ABV6ZT99_9PROT
MTAIPDDSWFADYAAGAGPAAVRTLISAQIEINSAAARRAAFFEAVASEFAFRDTVTTEAVPDLLDEHLRIPEPQPDPIYPAALARYGFTSDRKPWRSHLGGVSARKIKRLCQPGVDARLFRFAPGAAIPQHDHGGEELTLVLTGGFADEKGVYHRGDVAIGRAGEAHTPMGLPGEPCVCFAVSVGGYRFRNPIMSLAARWLE